MVKKDFEIVQNEKSYNQTKNDLRTRFQPKSRMSHGVVSIAPWVDIVFLIICFALLDARFTLQPGVVINLPKSSFSDGFRSRMVTIVLSVKERDSDLRKEIIFFNDERFFVKSDKDMLKLKNAFAESLRKHHESNLIIQADCHVQHGTLVKIFNMARDVGIKQVDVATNPL